MGQFWVGVDTRDRIIPEDQISGVPCELSLEDAEQVREKRESRVSEYDKLSGRSSGTKDRDWAAPSARANDKPWSKSTAKSPWTPQLKSQANADSQASVKPTSDDRGKSGLQDNVKRGVRDSGKPNLDPWANSRQKFKA